jgi:acyl-CoA synthetase (NDP forming)
VRIGFVTLLQRAHAANPKASIDGVLAQQMVSGSQEVILGIVRDPTFGPLVLFGLGGIYAEALADVSFRMAPLTTTDAEELLAEVRAAKLLAGLRGAPPADHDALLDALVRVSWLAHTYPQISELDINPLMVLPQGQGVCATDVRVVLNGVCLE